jgi:hypothetical protein
MINVIPRLKYHDGHSVAPARLRLAHPETGDAITPLMGSALKQCFRCPPPETMRATSERERCRAPGTARVYPAYSPAHYRLVRMPLSYGAVAKKVWAGCRKMFNGSGTPR